MTEIKKFAVVGDPIEHSLSPIMHNAAFKELNLDYEYVALRIPKSSLNKEFSRLKQFSGINVTIPHKQEIISLLDIMSETARMVGAVNCVAFEEGKSVGYNTDMTGAIEALCAHTGPINGKKIMILGAGGAARAIAYGCALEAAEVGVYNRTCSKAEDLVSDLNQEFGGGNKVYELKDVKKAEILINATSAGMHPNTNEIPIDSKLLHKKLTVMDIVYTPLETKLLKEAKKVGAHTVDGVEMFVNQGAESLRIWLGTEAPREVMREAVLGKLK